MGVRGLVWFDFEIKSFPNGKINKYAVWLSLIDFYNKIQIKPMWIGSVDAVFLDNIFFQR